MPLWTVELSRAPWRSTRTTESKRSSVSAARECASTLAAATPRFVTVLEAGYCDFLQERREECREMRDERSEKRGGSGSAEERVGKTAVGEVRTGKREEREKEDQER